MQAHGADARALRGPRGDAGHAVLDRVARHRRTLEPGPQPAGHVQPGRLGRRQAVERAQGVDRRRRIDREVALGGALRGFVVGRR